MVADDPWWYTFPSLRRPNILENCETLPCEVCIYRSFLAGTVMSVVFMGSGLSREHV